MALWWLFVIKNWNLWQITKTSKVVRRLMTLLLLHHYGGGSSKGRLSHLPASDVQRLQHTINRTRSWSLATQCFILNWWPDNTEGKSSTQWHRQLSNELHEVLICGSLSMQYVWCSLDPKWYVHSWCPIQYKRGSTEHKNKTVWDIVLITKSTADINDSEYTINAYFTLSSQGNFFHHFTELRSRLQSNKDIYSVY